ncbi:DNA-binding protein modulo isoform X2 [Drosophila innubila]|uniref:DNA-binding protein modulo isoform X2 n=1 Tax=Drosophila innubila TaxID=198719 RepID=UPI00148C28EC|nr:DNA-binding protein modulo isoform X2 [Drosophila innubila]
MAQKKVAGKKSAANSKSNQKAKKVVEEKPEMDVEASDDDSDASEEENGVNFDDGSDSEVKGASDLVDSEAEEDDEDDDDDEEDDDDDDEIEPGQISMTKDVSKATEEEADSDEEPVEAPITKKKQAEAPQKGGIPKIAVGRIPPETPKEHQLFISQLPNEYKHTELVALFTKFGPIAVVNRIKTKTGGNNVIIAFESAEGPESALAAKPKALTLNGQVLHVSRPHSKNELNERTIVIGLIGPNANKEQITEHFKSCGAVESVNFSNNRNLPTAYLRFKSVDSIPKALKLHGSEFNSRFITVREESYKNKTLKSPKCTLTIVNTGNHESYKADVIEKMFKKHGDITDVDVVCTRGILAFVTYETAEQAQKAMKQLNGKTVGDLEIKLEPYHYTSSARTILVTNLANGVEEDELNTIFSDCGEIESVKMLQNKALVKFTTDDGFCKSFLVNERYVQGQPMFVEPNSTIKHKILQKKVAAKNPNFRGNAAGGPAKFKKFGNNSNPNNKKPFNKRKAQENGSSSHSFKKTKKF